MAFKTVSLSDDDQRVISLIQEAISSAEGPVPAAQVVRRGLRVLAKMHKIELKGE